MKRQAIIIRSNGKRHICVDSEHYETILEYIQQDERHLKKFRHIADLILTGLRNTELYDKEEPNNKCKGKGIYGMKFFKGQENDRLYCKQFSTEKGEFIVVTVELYLGKKTQKLNAKQIAILEKIASYEYEIQ